MTAKKAVSHRIQKMCAERDMAANTLANRCGVPPSTVYSMPVVESQSPEIVSIQKTCGGRDISLRGFFDDPEPAIEQGDYRMFGHKFPGSRIRAVRLERKMAQEKLAEAAGVGVTHINHIETGNSIPGLQTLVDIINALGCTADELLCMEVRRSQPLLNNWLGGLVADCDDTEVKLITDMVTAMKSSMRWLRLSGEAGE